MNNLILVSWDNQPLLTVTMVTRERTVTVSLVDNRQGNTETSLGDDTVDQVDTIDLDPGVDKDTDCNLS